MLCYEGIFPYDITKYPLQSQSMTKNFFKDNNFLVLLLPIRWQYQENKTAMEETTPEAQIIYKNILED
jgi:hypothetical protein